MENSATPLSAEDVDVDLLAIGVTEGALAGLQTAGGALGQLASWAAQDEFTGKAGAAVIYPAPAPYTARRVVLVGLGKRSADELRRAAGKVGHLGRSRGAATVALAFDTLTASETAAAIEGFWTGNYRFEKYKPAADRKEAAHSLAFVGSADLSLQGRSGAILAGQTLARDIVNEQPANLYPETLAQEALRLANDRITVEVWDEHRIRAEGMGGITAVGQGSTRPARFIHLRYSPVGTPRRRIALVGKGVTFDSGGLSLKPSDGMQTMRCDMAGSAAVLGVMTAVSQLHPDVEVHGIIGAVENMQSGDCYKLGDILTMYNGKTVEIHNTDAEGRLVLADCLTYASRLGVEAVIDLATLTGACVVALGDTYSGLFANNDALASAVLEQADDAGEHVWRLPMPDHYKDKIKAEWGSIKNVGGREGGAITAALFLAEFVDGPAWVHLDIAGPAFFDKGFRHFVAGGSGAMVPTLTRWVLS